MTRSVVASIGTAPIAQWLVPHFEKMLYDNGQLASVYAEAHRRTGDAFYAEIVRETLDYVLREMTSPAGAFFSAQDAEVNHREGENYLWTGEQLGEVLEAAERPDLLDLAREIYGFNRGTNFQDPHHPEDGRKNVVFLIERPDEFAARFEVEQAALDAQLREINRLLLAVRDTRDQPITDDKILTAWNGLMIAGMADGGRILGEPRYVQAAKRAADYVLDTMRDEGGGLLRTARGGTARINAFLVDYAMMIRGLIALHRATEEPLYLEQAAMLASMAKANFADETAGGYFDTLAGQSDLFVRTKSTYDGAVPCGASTMVGNLLDLHELTDESAWLDEAVTTLRSLSPVISERPTSAVLAALALERMVREHPDRLEVAPAPRAGGGETKAGPLRIATSVARVEVGAQMPAPVDVTLTLEHGFHVNSHRPGIDYLIPLEITVAGGSGIEIEVDYPAGRAYDGPEGAMNVHDGMVTIPVRIRRTGEVTGQPQLMITYQVCNNTMCLRPDTRPLPLEIVAK